MAVVVTVAKGYDLGYIWKTQGQASAERTTGGYYINAAQAGEPPGRWWGPGAQALGFTPGQVVERKPYDAVYQQRDPRTGAKLGRARGRYATFADHLAQLKAAEPHATAERVIELEREAAQATRQPAAYYRRHGLVLQVDLGAARLDPGKRAPRAAGWRRRALAYWSGREQRFQEVLHRANRAALEYLQAWAGITRTGYHGARVDGREPGRFEDAGLVVTSWLQGTSRDGDPQDHIHNQIARITRTVRDGKWRALDTVSLRAVLGALQAVAATAVECELTREFGVDWVPRADGRGNEIAASRRRRWTRIPRGPCRCTRRNASSRGVGAQARPRADLARAAVHRQRRHPAVTQRQGRGRDRLGRAGRAVGRHPRRQLAGIAPAVSNARGPDAQRTSSRRRPGADRSAVARGPGTGSAEGPGAGVGAAAGLDPARPAQAARPGAAGRDPADEPGGGQELLLGLAEEALSGRAGEVVCLEAPEWPPLPASLRRELDGRSVYTRPGVAVTPPPRSCRLEERLVAQRRRKAHRACPASWPRGDWAPTPRC